MLMDDITLYKEMMILRASDQQQEIDLGNFKYRQTQSERITYTQLHGGDVHIQMICRNRGTEGRRAHSSTGDFKRAETV